MIKVSIINNLLKESKEKDIFILNEINERKLDTTQEEIIKYLLSTYIIEDEWTTGSDRYDDYFSRIKLKNGEYRIIVQRRRSIKKGGSYLSNCTIRNV